MKYFLLLILNLFSLSSYAGNSVSNGGNVLPDEQVSVTEYQKFLQTARARLLVYLYQNSTLNPALTQSLLETAQTTSLSVLLEKPCLDESGEASDGSSVGFNSNSICLSLPRLQQKLSVYNYKSQILALMAHEFSHRLGFDEAHATELQKTVLNDFKQQIPDLEVLNTATPAIMNAFLVAQSYAKGLDSLSWENSNEQAVHLFNQFQGGLKFYSLKKKNSWPLNSSEVSWVQAMMIKSQALTWGTCWLSRLICDKISFDGNKARVLEIKKYKLAFEGHSSMALDKFYANIFEQNPRKEFSSYEIRWIQTVEDVKKELEEVQAVLSLLSARLDLITNTKN